MPKDPRALALLVHVAIYAVAIAICAGVNLWLSPDNLWFVWIALGWGIGVAAHALAFWLRHTRRRERVFIDCKARGATVHLFAYVAVVVLLFIVNLTMTPKVWWFYWVALGWGAGVAPHVWCAFFRKSRPTSGPQPAPQPARKRAAAKKRAVKKTAAKKARAPRNRHE